MHLIFAALCVFALFNHNGALFALVLLSGLLNPAITIAHWIRLAVRSYLKFSLYAIVLFLTSLKTFLKSRGAAELTGSIITVRGALLRGTSVCFAFLSVIDVIAIVATRATMSISIAQEWINMCVLAHFEPTVLV
ncbi:hypothetical protein EVJ58_g6492 [Rhodofomes roseus]|uniref:Uncharacterized protein n=1 Tax=Rhodofomes roseus TaxID=34475 RepID=A0A4Y9Y8V0_9APHY|nr:hypothetical protein EVJ58_g6492 [Rhodofomes roseus]